MTNGPGFDPFAVLGVGADADAVVIQLAYRARIRAVHPDVAGPAGLEAAKRLNLARDWLLDPERRAQLSWSSAAGRSESGQRTRPGKGFRRAHAWGRARRTHADGGSSPHRASTSGQTAERLHHLLRAIRSLSPDERARVNYSLGESRPPSFDAYEPYLGADLAARSRALRVEVERAWEHGIDEPAPYLHPLGRIVPSGFLVANAYAQWILLGDVLREELGDAAYRREHLYDAFAARCRGPWEGSVGHARYGPHGPRVKALLRAAQGLPANSWQRMAAAWFRHLGRDGRDRPSDRVGPGIWLPSPVGYPAALTVSGYVAAVDAARIQPPAGLSQRDEDGFRYGLRLTAHVVALGLRGRAADEYLRPWRESVGAAI
jgi:curved DNA-binding protein CbpA